MKLKSNLHCHTSDDPEDDIPYSPYEAISTAAKKGFEVLSFTCHNLVARNPRYERFAEERGILLIPGIEKTIEGKHVVIVNADKDAERIETFSDLEKYKDRKKNILVLAPHPFFPSLDSLRKRFFGHTSLFDAVERSWFASKLIDFNKKAEKVAREYGLPYLATSDTHDLSFLDVSYAIIESEKKDIESVIEAIRRGSFSNRSRPIGFLKEMFFYAVKMKLLDIFSGKPTSRRQSDA